MLKEAQETIDEKIVPMIRAIVNGSNEIILSDPDSTLGVLVLSPSGVWMRTCPLCMAYRLRSFPNECQSCPLFKVNGEECFKSRWYEDITRKLSSKRIGSAIPLLLGIKMELEAL